MAIDENYTYQKIRPTKIKANENKDRQKDSTDENFILKSLSFCVFSTSTDVRYENVFICFN